MASIKITLSIILFLTISIHSKAELGLLKETKMSFYYHDYAGGPNATTIEARGPSTEPLSFIRFGASFVTDDPITEEIEEGSTLIARGRGTYVISALDGTHAQVVMSIVFINGEYKGSTLEIQGSYAQFERLNEAAVVGGTGIFRLARGYATYEVLSYDSVSGYSVTQSNMTVLHY
ncbi:dirigent protein 22-like [Salvia miltiorrhiza]|uniref:dirigent protein 22-like n=1 Tax=Salvia miltiorrhiza TaxID=226208 RepID=UPI0025AC9D41|nr:dirigent protein 22-like [Salvia miltiorrhiza]